MEFRFSCVKLRENDQRCTPFCVASLLMSGKRRLEKFDNLFSFPTVSFGRLKDEYYLDTLDCRFSRDIL